MSIRKERLAAAAEWAVHAEMCTPGVHLSARPCGRPNDAPALIRRVGRPLVIRGTGRYLILDQDTGHRIGSAYWSDGTLWIYGPPWPGRRRRRNGEGGGRGQVVERPRAVWAAVLALLGDELREDESPGEALARVEKTEQFRELVK